MFSGNKYIMMTGINRIVLDPVFPSPDLGHNRKCAINEIPQELKFTLVFNEKTDKHHLIPSEARDKSDDIESD